MESCGNFDEIFDGWCVLREIARCRNNFATVFSSSLTAGFNKALCLHFFQLNQQQWLQWIILCRDMNKLNFIVALHHLNVSANSKARLFTITRTNSAAVVFGKVVCKKLKIEHESE